MVPREHKHKGLQGCPKRSGLCYTHGCLWDIAHQFAVLVRFIGCIHVTYMYVRTQVYIYICAGSANFEHVSMFTHLRRTVESSYHWLYVLMHACAPHVFTQRQQLNNNPIDGQVAEEVSLRTLLRYSMPVL